MSSWTRASPAFASATVHRTTAIPAPSTRGCACTRRTRWRQRPRRRRLASGDPPPLCGVPIGSRTSRGRRQTADRLEPRARRDVPERDSDVWTRLAAAGWSCSATCTRTSSPPAARPNRSATRGRSTARRADRAAVGAALAARMMPPRPGPTPPGRCGSRRHVRHVDDQAHPRPPPDARHRPLVPVPRPRGPMRGAWTTANRCSPRWRLEPPTGARDPAARGRVAPHRGARPGRCGRVRRRASRARLCRSWSASAGRLSSTSGRAARLRLRRDARVSPSLRRPSRPLPPVDARTSSSRRARARSAEEYVDAEADAPSRRRAGSTGSPSTGSTRSSNRPSPRRPPARPRIRQGVHGLRRDLAHPLLGLDGLPRESRCRPASDNRKRAAGQRLPDRRSGRRVEPAGGRRRAAGRLGKCRRHDRRRGVVAIDVHVHTERSRDGHDPMPP